MRLPHGSSSQFKLQKLEGHARLADYCRQIGVFVNIGVTCATKSMIPCACSKQQYTKLIDDNQCVIMCACSKQQQAAVHKAVS